jgi:hypothetical protein
MSHRLATPKLSGATPIWRMHHAGPGAPRGWRQSEFRSTGTTRRIASFPDL